ncbi:MAG: DUF4270 family protein [Bacteroidales bacterium]|nr:DUF4270 family protein [Bacteroidales bacterium]
MELNNIFSRQFFAISLVAVYSVLLLTSCSEEPIGIERRVLPEEEGMEVFTRTFPVELFNIESEALETYSLGYSPLGSVNDPVFGRIKAGFLSDFFLKEFPDFATREDIIVDTANTTDEIAVVIDTTEMDTTTFQVSSLELKLYFNGYFGDNSKINFNVYELISRIPDEELSDFEITEDMYEPVPLNTVQPEPVYDKENGKLLYYHVIFSDEYAKRLFNRLFNDSTLFLERIFRANFPGFYFETQFLDEAGGGMIRIDHENSSLTLWTIKNGEDFVANEFYLAFQEIDGTSLNLYSAEYSNEINDILGDTVNLPENVYLQALAGPKALMKFPTLAQFKDSLDFHYIINRAELVLPVGASVADMKRYDPPKYLGVHDIINDSTILDDGIGTSYFGGELDKTKMEYSFELGNHVHDFLRDETNTTGDKLFLFAASIQLIDEYTAINGYSLTSPGRVILKNADSDNPPYLRIIYSKIPD